MPAEVRDKLSWIGILVGLGALGIAAASSVSLKPLSRTLSGVATVIASVFFTTMLAAVEVLAGLENRLWFGFGWAGAACFLCFSFLLYALSRHLGEVPRAAPQTDVPKRSSRFRELPVLGITAGSSIFFYGALPIQPSWSVVDRYHSRYVINEIVGPWSGNWGLGNHITQYASTLGVPLVVLRPFKFTISEVYAIATAYTSLLGMLTVTLVFALTWRLSAPSARAIMPFLAVGLTLVSQANPVGFMGPISVLMSAVPGRLLPVMLVFTFLFSFARRPSGAAAFILGASVGFCLVNNFEFGATTAASTMIGLMVLRTSAGYLMAALVAALLTITSYFALVVLDGNTIDLGAWFLFSLGFGSGFGSIAMPLFGVWIAVVGVFLFAAALSVRRIKCLHLNLTETSMALVPVHLLVLAASTNGLLQFGYYAGRSVNSGQLQILLVYVGLVSAGLSHELCRSSVRSAGSRWVLVMLVALPALALPSTRWPISEWQRVVGVVERTSLASRDEAILRDEELVKAVLGGADSTDLVIVLEGSNLLSIGTGVESSARTNNPADLRIGKPIRDRICAAIEREDRRVLTSTVLQEATPPWCGATPVLITGLPADRIVLSNSR